VGRNTIYSVADSSLYSLYLRSRVDRVFTDVRLFSARYLKTHTEKITKLDIHMLHVDES